MTTETIEEAEQRLERFAKTLATYDDPLVAEVADAVAESDVWGLKSPDLSPDEWLDVLETAGDELYLYAHEASHEGMSDAQHKWYARYDGEEFIYGTENTGELYRGDRDENAARQIRAVIEGHDAYPKPMERYPLEEVDEYQEVPGDR